MGRRPKAVALKIVEGNPGKRSLSAGVEPCGTAPECPGHLDGAARTEFERVASALGKSVCPLDASCLASYAVLYARWAAAETELVGESLLLTHPNGHRFPNPLLGIAESAAKGMLRFACELGLTPASRRLLAPTKQEPDELESFLSARRNANRGRPPKASNPL